MGTRATSGGLASWRASLRRDAKKDGLALFRQHLRRLDLPDEPKLLLSGTICIVEACSAYAAVDGRPLAAFLDWQTYDPAAAGDARYAFTFDICGHTYGRVLVPSKVGNLDLADLFEWPWRDYGCCGYNRFWVTRSDGADLTSEELEQLEQQVRKDLFYDNTEEELDVDFDTYATAGALLVSLYRLSPDDDDGEAK